MLEKPTPQSSLAAKEIEKAQKQFDAQEEQIKQLTLDRMNQAPKLEVEPQTKIAQKDLAKMNDIYLKPNRVVSSREKFNEAYREDYNFRKEYVQFTAENHEVIGESITTWIKCFPGMPAEEWIVPVNKPVWAPRYVAERIKGSVYHRLQMEEKKVIGEDGLGQYIGQFVSDRTVQRLDALPVYKNRSIFMGSTF